MGHLQPYMHIFYDMESLWRLNLPRISCIWHLSPCIGVSLPRSQIHLWPLRRSPGASFDRWDNHAFLLHSTATKNIQLYYFVLYFKQLSGESVIIIQWAVGDNTSMSGIVPNSTPGSLVWIQSIKSFLENGSCWSRAEHPNHLWPWLFPRCNCPETRMSKVIPLTSIPPGNS